MHPRLKALTIFTVYLGGCATAPLQPPDMTAGWSTHQGQAVWNPPRAKTGIAGELLVATNSVGDFVVEFSKPPFTIASAQRQGDRWQVQFPAENKRYSGRGSGPSAIIWLKMVPAFSGRGEGWNFSTNADGFKLERNRESLEGFLAP